MALPLAQAVVSIVSVNLKPIMDPPTQPCALTLFEVGNFGFKSFV